MGASRKAFAWTATGVLTTAGLIGLTAGPAAAVDCALSLAGDVNGDGHSEAVVGEPFDNASQTGAVHLLYGTIEGLVADASGTALDDQLFTQNTAGVPGDSEVGDAFGSATLLADFNGDSCADLATGAPGENGNVGRVVVLYGSPDGVTTVGAQSLSENTLFGAGAGQGGETFGDALASGDFNDDTFVDLVVGVPGEQVNVSSGGGVAVVYGSAGGLGEGPTDSVLLTQASAGVPGGPESGDLFGSAGAGGDFDGDGVDDLAIGVPGEDGSGIVQVLPGQAGTGVGSVAGVSFSQSSPDVPGANEQGDRFGSAVAAGNVNGGAEDDLAVGAPGENGVASGPEPFGEGAVVFLPGSASGLTGTGSQFWSQDSAGVSGVAANHDNFGDSLSVARLDNGTLDDLAIGVPFDDTARANTGSVNILVGRASGLSTAEAGGQRFTQDTAGVGGTTESGDQFGRSVSAPSIQTPDQGNLVIGAPSEDVGAAANTGVIHQFSTSEFGPNPTGSRSFHLDTAGVKGTPAGGDLFGFTVG